MIFDSIRIEKFIFSFLHVEIGIRNKIINSFYDWITKYAEPLSDEEIEMLNVLVLTDLQISFNQNK